MNDLIFINSIEGHEEHKQSLLSKIDVLKEEHELLVKGVHTDWNLSYGLLLKSQDIDLTIKREYLDEFYSLIDPAMESMAKSLGLLSGEYQSDYRWGVTNAWFNQYSEEGAEHGWHNHPGFHFTNCYYLELPDAEYKTDVVGLDGKIIEFTVKEGDVMTCPAWMKHRSKPNGPKRKTIIAFNTNYEL